MYSDKFDCEYYRKKIDESQLFYLDKNLEESAYAKAKKDLLNNIWLYLKKINCNVKDFGVEIAQTVENCIEYFDSSKGDFLNYFLRSWKQNYKVELGSRNWDNHLRGINVSYIEKQKVYQIEKAIEKTGISRNTLDFYKIVSELTGYSIEDIKGADRLNDFRVVRDHSMFEDGEEISIIDLIELDYIENYLKLDNDEGAYALMNKIQEQFNSLQERTKPILSDIFTIELGEILFECKIDYSKFSFINADIMKEYKKSGMLPNQKDIAKKYNKNEASISRMKKNFIEGKLRENI